MEVKGHVTHFFQNRFQEHGYHRPTLDGVQFKSISEAQNEMLAAPFEEDEIRNAVWECGSSKCPGPDVFNFKFIKAFWETLNVDICRFMSEFHANGKFPRGSNSTFISLIPKKANPQNLEDYRPISLVGCMYKILSKVLANRIKRVLLSIIDERQSAFLEGRQGDPLAPFLFTVVAEGLTGLMREAEKCKIFTGVSVGKEQVKISITQYADDTMFFGEASQENVIAIKGLLRCFELVSGLKVNFSKSKFSAIGIDIPLAESYAHLLNCTLLQIPFCYLGLPIGANPRKKATWEPILVKLRKKGKVLSMAGRVWLGVKNVTLFNTAMLAKWRWTLFHLPSSVWSQVLLSKYGLLIVCGGDEEGNWFDKMIEWRVGEGSRVRLWLDKWAGTTSLAVAYPRLFINSTHQHSSIVDWKRNRFAWEASLEEQLYQTIRGINFHIAVQDSWRWLGDSSGEFSIRSAYKALIAEYASAENDEVSNSIWLTPVPPKVQMCVWRMVNNGLPSVDNLARRYITLGEQQSLCQFCNGVAETSNHIFCTCPEVDKIWKQCLSWIKCPAPLQQQVR
uniref:Transposon TX1 uncharacterized n=1 Tax=Cajanus cajan TaxID=3821 RepID=A0A151SA14_CAJCA|nr:Transposon TX1 uncharacterized [Cajanus cajan]